MKLKRLYSSKLFKQLRALIENLMSEMFEHCPEKGIKIDQSYILNLSEKYTKSIFEILSNLINTVEQLNFIPIFISNYESKKIFLESGINHERYIEYHLENHFLKITSIFDQSIILVNEIHDLGISSKSISLRLLRENKHMKNVPSVNLLKEFEKGIQKIKHKRNQIVHAGEFKDSELNKLFIDELFKKAKIHNSSKSVNINDIIEKKIDFLNSNNEQITEIVSLLLESLYIEFNYKLEELNKR